MTRLEYITTPDPVWRPFAFDHIEVKSPHGNFSLLGKCYSEYESGPNLCTLADVAGAIQGPGFYGLAFCRSLRGAA